MTLERIVEHVLMTSDNDGAEVLLRQAGVAGGRKGTFTDGTAVVAARLKDLGVWTSGTRLVDGSGLSRSTRIPAATLTKLLRAAGQDSHPRLRALLTGLPVAGVEGSLATKFGDDQSLAGRGVVRGKTGTLTKVHGLAGTITTRDGEVLTYAFLVNNPEERLQRHRLAAARHRGDQHLRLRLRTSPAPVRTAAANYGSAHVSRRAVHGRLGARPQHRDPSGQAGSGDLDRGCRSPPSPSCARPPPGPSATSPR